MPLFVERFQDKIQFSSVPKNSCIFFSLFLFGVSWFHSRRSPKIYFDNCLFSFFFYFPHFVALMKHCKNNNHRIVIRLSVCGKWKTKLHTKKNYSKDKRVNSILQFVHSTKEEDKNQIFFIFRHHYRTATKT